MMAQKRPLEAWEGTRTPQESAEPELWAVPAGALDSTRGSDKAHAIQGATNDMSRDLQRLLVHPGFVGDSQHIHQLAGGPVAPPPQTTRGPWPPEAGPPPGLLQRRGPSPMAEGAPAPGRDEMGALAPVTEPQRLRHHQQQHQEEQQPQEQAQALVRLSSSSGAHAVGGPDLAAILEQLMGSRSTATTTPSSNPGHTSGAPDACPGLVMRASGSDREGEALERGFGRGAAPQGLLQSLGPGRGHAPEYPQGFGDAAVHGSRHHDGSGGSGGGGNDAWLNTPPVSGRGLFGTRVAPATAAAAGAEPAAPAAGVGGSANPASNHPLPSGAFAVARQQQAEEGLEDCTSSSAPYEGNDAGNDDDDIDDDDDMSLGISLGPDVSMRRVIAARMAANLAADELEETEYSDDDTSISVAQPSDIRHASVGPADVPHIGGLECLEPAAQRRKVVVADTAASFYRGGPGVHHRGGVLEDAYGRAWSFGGVDVRPMGGARPLAYNDVDVRPSPGLALRGGALMGDMGVKWDGVVDPWARGLDDMDMPGFHGGVSTLAPRRQERWDFGELISQLRLLGPDELLLQRTMELGQALEDSDLVRFRQGFRWLSQFANPRGKAVGRLVHYVLHGLLLRCTGMGHAAFNTPSTRPVKDISAAHLWYYRHVPTVRLFQVSMTSSLMHYAEGRPQVHVIEFGFYMTSHWPTVFRQLAQQHAASGAPGPLHFRLTLIRLGPLISPGRSDLKEVSGKQQDLALWLKVSAVSAGITLELEVLDVDRYNLPQLTVNVKRRPWELLMVIAGLDFDYLLDNSVLEYGIRETILEWVTTMEPATLAMASLDMDVNDLPMLTRMRNLIKNQAPIFCANDFVAEQSQGWEQMYAFEELFMGRGCANVLSCEGSERVVRSQQLERWRGCMDAAGLAPGHILGLEECHSMLKGYPDGWGLQVEHGSMCLLWKGWRTIALSMWVPKHTQQ